MDVTAVCLALGVVTVSGGFLLATAEGSGPEATVVDVRRIWDQAPHNAFTDLLRFQGRFYCAFREGQAHVSPDGALRVLRSDDGDTWQSVVRFTQVAADVRDAKLSITPAGELMLSGAAALHQPAAVRHRSAVWFSADGAKFTDRLDIGDPDFWMWSVTWHKGVAYSIGYRTVDPQIVRLYHSRDGRAWETLVERLFEEGYPNETSLVFDQDDTCWCLLRRDAGRRTAQLGRARPPYKEWTWRDLGVQIGGPKMLQLPDGRLLAGVRLYGPQRTSLSWVDRERGRLEEFLRLPSGGDTSYPGLLWHNDLLWVSYYSSHERKTAIYLAKVRIPLLPTTRKTKP